MITSKRIICEMFNFHSRHGWLTLFVSVVSFNIGSLIANEHWSFAIFSLIVTLLLGIYTGASIAKKLSKEDNAQ